MLPLPKSNLAKQYHLSGRGDAQGNKFGCYKCSYDKKWSNGCNILPFSIATSLQPIPAHWLTVYNRGRANSIGWVSILFPMPIVSNFSNSLIPCRGCGQFLFTMVAVYFSGVPISQCTKRSNPNKLLRLFLLSGSQSYVSLTWPKTLHLNPYMRPCWPCYPHNLTNERAGGRCCCNGHK